MSAYNYEQHVGTCGWCCPDTPFCLYGATLYQQQQISELTRQLAEKNRSVKPRIGKSVLTRDLVWCECGRGLSLFGRWIFCPTCGCSIDQTAYAQAVEEANQNGAILYRNEEMVMLTKQLAEATERAEKAERLDGAAFVERESVKAENKRLQLELDAARKDTERPA